MEEGPDEFNEQPDESNLYKHIKEAEKGTSETVDAATQVFKLLYFYRIMVTFLRYSSHVKINFYGRSKRKSNRY